MELKQKWRRFWTLNRHHEDGFTLVELVVVIAILAILAAVTVPAYDDYITKAKESADQQIVAAVNTAFAAACVENKVDTVNVTDAAVSVVDNKVQGLSRVTATKTETSDEADFGKIYDDFAFYYAGNEDAAFKNGSVNSLLWNASKCSFEISADFVDTRVTLSSGKVITVSADDMALIAASTYADMGYGGVKAVIEQVGESGAMLAKICGIGTLPNIFGGGYTGLLPKLTNAMKAFGIIDENKEKEIINNLLLTNAGKESYNVATQEASNGLSIITAKYLAGGGDVNELLSISLGNSSSGVIKPMATGTGGVKTVSAIAVQYAMASGFANSDAAKDVKIDGMTVSEYLASADDPVKAIDTVKNLDAYKSNYVSDDPNSQYQKDINGFVGTMSILGDNIGTITNPGNIDMNDYLSNGVESDDAKDVLTSVLGK